MKHRILLAVGFLASLLFFVVLFAGVSYGGTSRTRAEDLLKKLDSLKEKIEVIPQNPPSLTTQIQLTGTGVDAGYTRALFGILNPGEARDITIAVKNTGAPLRSIDVRGLSAPFSFKGGAYPGTGGTCGALLSGECTIVLRYAPTTAIPGIDVRGGVSRHVVQIHVEAEYAKEVNDFPDSSNSFVLIGFVKKQGEIGMGVTQDLQAKLIDQPEAVIPGESSPFTVHIGLRDPLDTRPVFFKDVKLSGIGDPFVVKNNDCEKNIVAGSCNITLSFRPSTDGTFRRTLSVSFDSGQKKNFTLQVAGQAYDSSQNIVAEKNILVAYNADWPESVEVKNYYLVNRPGFINANTIGLHFAVPGSCNSLNCLASVLEIVPYSSVRSKMVEPILAWMRDHPEKDIQYVVFMRGLPTRSSGEDVPNFPHDAGDPAAESTQLFLYEATRSTFGKGVFLSSLDMGSLESTKRYIDKVKSLYSIMPVKSLLVSARGTSMEGNTYYMSDVQRQGAKGDSRARWALEALKKEFPNVQSSYRSYEDYQYPSTLTAANVTGYMSWGIYEYRNGTGVGGWNGDYPVNGTVKFSGKSDWYLIQTVESFNGLWQAAGHQGNFIKWFSANAFGGTDYHNTPAAAVTHTIEPSSGGINYPELWPCWEKGNPFSYCAWKTYGSTGAQAVGDPLVTR